VLIGAAALLTPALMFLALYFGTARKPQDISKNSNGDAPTIRLLEINPSTLIRTPTAPPQATQVAGATSSTRADLQPGCAVADSALGVKIVNREEVPVFASPGRVPVEGWDEKPLLLDPRFEIRIQEEVGNWVRVRITPPMWPRRLGERSGWIERQSIQSVVTPDENLCLFLDVNRWSGVAEDVKYSIHEIALRILNEDRRCARISRGGYLGQGQRFFLTCYPSDGGRPYHYWLSISDNFAKLNFSPPTLTSPEKAEERCTLELKKALARRAKVFGRPAESINIASRRVSTRNGVHYVTLNVRSNESSRGVEVAYCLVPPSGDVEVTLDEENSTSGP
jgi:hypothetical protein